MKMIAALSVLAMLVFAAPAHAQNPPIVPGSVLAFDHPSNSAPTAGFALCVDRPAEQTSIDGCTDLGALTHLPGPNIGETPAAWEYRFVLPSLTPGAHALKVAAYNTAGAVLSTPLIVEVFAPSAPLNLRVLPPGSAGGGN